MKLALVEKHGGCLDAADERDQVRLWLRLLSLTMVVDKRLRQMLAERFRTTLPRFDVLAALERAPEGLTMGQLSRALLVSNGNVTALVQALDCDGLVEAARLETDRRTQIVRLTPAGRRAFEGQAETHHRLIGSLFAGLDMHDREQLHRLLGRLRDSVAAAPGETR